MPEISKVTLPSGGTYDIKDAWAREHIASGITLTIVWNANDYASSSAPSSSKLATIPAGVTVYYNNGANSATGTLAASTSTKAAFYLIYSKSQVGDNDTFDEYVTYEYTFAGQPRYAWEKIGDTQISLSNTDTVLGAGTTFIGSASGAAVSSTTKYMKATASGTAVGKTTKYLSASASGTAVGADGTASAVTGYASPTSDTVIKTLDTTKKLVTTTVPNVTSAGSASTWDFQMGTGEGNTETLIISGGNGTAPTLGTAKTVATGSVTTSGTGATVVTGSTATASCLTGLGSPSTATVLTGVQVTSQPTITLTANSSTSTGRITYLESLGTVTQPTISLAAESSSATGRAEFIQSIDSVTQPTIAVAASATDIVTVYTP